MQKTQWILAGSGVLVLILLYAFGSTSRPHDHTAHSAEAHGAAPQQNQPIAISLDSLEQQAMLRLSPDRQERIRHLTALSRTASGTDKVTALNGLLRFYMDTVHDHTLGAYYMGQSAELDKSEKKLTFAARLLSDELMQERDPALKTWQALQAKALFEKVLALNPGNDSAQIALGALYMFGGISANPMEGILKVRTIAEKNPSNVYAQMVLGMGGVQSGQFDKAIERFRKVVQLEPNNLEAIFRLAETYERKGRNDSAVIWYTQVVNKIQVPEARAEIQQRINTLKQTENK